MPTEDPPNGITRRQLLAGGALAAGAAVLGKWGLSELWSPRARTYPGSIVGGSAKAGHRLRGGALPTPTDFRDVETIVVGGGIAGLSAGWWLERNGYRHFEILELESEVGGNSTSGANGISPYPWAAHYLPLPGPEAHYVRTLLEELKVITGYEKGLPIYDEFHLCADPHERLFYQGRWQEGLVPQIGLTEDDHRQYREFFGFIEAQKVRRGNDGRPAFAVPVAASSHDPKIREWDELTMAEFLAERRWNSKPLLWYVNYCCRDDYGATAANVSAWAGIHYFASRVGKGANADAQTVLTWPEGNGWLVKRLREKIGDRVSTGRLVYSVEEKADGVYVDSLDVRTNVATRVRARQVIFAAPRFIAAHVVDGMRKSRPNYLADLQYSPWMVANVSLKHRPHGNGASLAWDNVSFYSKSLGYVVATHQGLSLYPQKTVVTYYLPLSHRPPSEARKEALEKSHAQWAKEIAEDLARMHRGIDDDIEHIDVWLWGHGMIVPQVGFITGLARQGMQASLGRVHFAHSDMSGISIFEEAQYHGIEAAKRVLGRLGRGGVS